MMLKKGADLQVWGLKGLTLHQGFTAFEHFNF